MATQDNGVLYKNIYRVTRRPASPIRESEELWGAVLIAEDDEGAREVLEDSESAGALLEYAEDLVWEHIGETTGVFVNPVILLYDIHFNIIAP